MSRTAPEFSDNADQFGDGIEDQAFETHEAEVVADGTVTEQAEAPASDEDAKHEAELEAFQAAAQASAEQADEDGHLNGDQLAPAVNAYRAISSGAKGKNKAKAYVAEQMKAALTSGPDGYSRAMAWNSIQDSILSAPTKAAAEPKAAVKVDPNEAYAQKVAALELALRLAKSNLPEGVTESGYADKLAAEVEKAEAEAERLYEFEFGTRVEGAEAPEAGAVAKAAVKLVSAKVARKGAGRKATSEGGSTYAGPRRDVAVHITNAFAGLESGTFLKISEIRGIRSDEYGDDAPSAGAVSARLFPASGKCTVEGVIPGTDENGNRGAIKA